MANLTIAQQLNEQVLSVIGEHNIQGFEKAFLIAEATNKLKALLTPEYMKPIMALQGNKLGFKSDKVYSEQIVKDCLIEAVLTGLQPHGNQFNIIAGNMYPTKEGLGYLLSNFKGLSYDITHELPRINSTNTSAAIIMNITWSINSVRREKSIDFPIKMNKFMGTDAVIGKATRKARAWLYSTITGSEISEGDITDLDSPVHLNNATTIDPGKIAETKEYNRISDHIENATTLKKLTQVKNSLKDQEQEFLYAQKELELKEGSDA